MPEDSVALWYWRYHSLDYDLCDDEEGAASMAVAMTDNGGASVAGVQFPDGRAVPVSRWTAFHEAAARIHAAEDAAREEARSMPKRAMREVRSPFSNSIATIGAEAPAWLGRPK